MMLTKAMQNDIAKQMYNKARDIDVATFNALDNSMPNDMIVDALMFYLCKDGGFGQGLHIDNYNTNSSPYQVYEAYRIMDMVGLDSNCEHEYYDYIINKSMNYLYNRCEIKNNKWNPNTLTNNNFAHSSLFEYCDENTKLFGYAPTAAILGYTLLLCKPTKAYYKKALRMIDVMLKDFYKMESLSKYEFISFGSFLNSIKKANLYIEDQAKIEEKLINLGLECVKDNYSSMHAILPLDCFLYINDERVNSLKEEQLNYTISSVASHGLWEYTGSWGYDKYAEEDSAKIKWLGAISVNNYYMLKINNKVEE